MDASVSGQETRKAGICFKDGVSIHAGLLLNRKFEHGKDCSNINAIDTIARYDIMMSCWDVDPKARPSFAHLRDLLCKELHIL